MRQFAKTVLALFMLSAAPALAQDNSASAPPPYEPYGMGYGGMMGYGPGMMGPGMMGGYGAMGPGMRWGHGDLHLSADNVRDYFQRWIAFGGSSHIKLGAITVKDADTITVDIVTRDKDALVERFLVDRHSGVMRAEG